MSSSEDLRGEVMQVNAVAEAVQDVTVATFASQLGWMSTVWHGGRLAGLSFGHRSAAAARRSLGITSGEEEQWTADMRQVVQRLQQFARGGRDEFLDVAIDLGRRTRFQRAVLEQCRRISLGQVWTYGQLAAQVGSPGAARAVGSVLAGNRLPLIIPCHRVVGARGALGGFSAPDGVRMKRRLLHLERAEWLQNRPLQSGRRVVRH